MIGLTNSVNVAGSSGGGDVIYATNDSSGTIAAGGKVWLNYRTVSSEAKHFVDRSGTYSSYYDAGNSLLNLISGSNLYRTTFDGDATWSEKQISTCRSIEGDDFFRKYEDGTICLQSANAKPKSTVFLNTGDTTGVDGVYLGQDLLISGSSTITLKSTGGETYATFSLPFTNANKISNAFLEGNTLLIEGGNQARNKFAFYDITNKSSPSLIKSITFQENEDIFITHATGTTSGNYLIGCFGGYGNTQNPETLFFCKINEDNTLSNTDDVIPEQGQPAAIMYSNANKVLMVGTSSGVYAYRYNDGVFTSVPLDLDFSSTTRIANGCVYNPMFNNDLTCIGVGYCRYDSRFTRYASIIFKNTEATGWTIVDESAVNSLTITGFATGETDAEGRYEISTVLPDEVKITVNVTPDPDTFEFTGEAQ